MPVPTSSIGLSDIAAEFGGTSPHSLSEYWGAHPSVPPSGMISIGDFSGLSNVVVSLPDGSASKNSTVSAAATACGVRFNSNGTVDKYAYNTWSYFGDWITPTSAADLTYEFKLDINSDTGGSGLISGSAGVWGENSWTIRDETQDGTAHAMGVTISVRKDGGATMDTCSWSFTSNWLP